MGECVVSWYLVEWVCVWLVGTWLSGYVCGSLAGSWLSGWERSVGR